MVPGQLRWLRDRFLRGPGVLLLLYTDAFGQLLELLGAEGSRAALRWPVPSISSWGCPLLGAQRCLPQFRSC